MSSRSFDHNARIQSLPRIGQTRCCQSPRCDHTSIVLNFYFTDWAMLSADLDFIYLDPVLQSHLEEQAESLLGKSLLTFVHPDEQASAKQDLGGVLNSRTLHGSVTRYVPLPLSHASLIHSLFTQRQVFSFNQRPSSAGLRWPSAFLGRSR
jgi:hypothetical protein